MWFAAHISEWCCFTRGVLQKWRRRGACTHSTAPRSSSSARKKKKKKQPRIDWTRFLMRYQRVWLLSRLGHHAVQPFRSHGHMMMFTGIALNADGRSLTGPLGNTRRRRRQSGLVTTGLKLTTKGVGTCPPTHHQRHLDSPRPILFFPSGVFLTASLY